MEPAPLAFDLVLASVDRVDELRRFFDSLEHQSHRRFRVVLVDQNADDRLESLVAERAGLEITHLRAPRGLSRARNAGLAQVTGDIVAFPDDDCVYPEGLLEGISSRFTDRPLLDGLTGRAVGTDGSSSPSWARDPAILAPDNLWNRAVSFAIFLRRHVVEEVGRFDEELGLGSGTRWSSGEEVDYVLRAVLAGAKIEYDPALTVTHDEEPLSPDGLRSIGHRDGASVGYILRKHRYPARTLARMAVRPLGAALLASCRGDGARARFHAATLQGRIAGYRGFTHAS